MVFTGHVQGVGFRYTTRSIAKRYPVAGYVKNQQDGTVLLVAQGAPVAVDSFLLEVSERFRPNIVRAQRETIADGERFSGFEIRF